MSIVTSTTAFLFLALLDEYLNLYYCTYLRKFPDVAQNVYRMVVVLFSGGRAKSKTERKSEAGENNILQVEMALSGFYYSMAKMSFSFSNERERRYCASWFISEKQLIIKCLLWWICEMLRRDFPATGTRWFFSSKLIMWTSNSFAFERRLKHILHDATFSPEVI